MKIALALSGGGFRASLFHLGVIRRLRAEGLLRNVSYVASVSGGSITAGHLKKYWESYNAEPSEFDHAARNLIDLTSVDLRGRIQRRLPFIWLLSFIPFLADRISLTKLLAWYYDRYLFGGDTLASAGQNTSVGRPTFFILSTNLSSASLTAFAHPEILGIPLNSSGAVSKTKASLTPLSHAVSASSAYPGFFPPLQLNDSDVGAQPGTFGTKSFTDAGIFDNLGVYGLEQGIAACAGATGVPVGPLMIIASDAGRSFVPQTEVQYGLLRTAIRAVDIFMFRIRQFDLAKYTSDRSASSASPAPRAIPATAQASSYLLISISESVSTKGASAPAIQAQLEDIRTDLDKFSELEAFELIKHGYYVTAHQIALSRGNAVCADLPDWDPTHKSFNARSDAQSAQDAKRLQRSALRKWRLMSWTDWISWLHLAMALSLVGTLYMFRGEILDRAYAMIAGYKAYSLRQKPPAWTEPPVLNVQTTSVALQPSNDGFEVLNDDRVWDLRQLRAKHLSGGILSISGPMLLTRTSTLIKRSESDNEYAYLYLTAAKNFSAWSPDASAVRLLKSEQPAVSGSNRLTSYELQLDVTRNEVGKPFVLRAQARTVDAPWDPSNTWLGMRITDGSPAASMRIIFPENLPYKNPLFLIYPNDTSLASQSSDGIVLDRISEKELIWRVDRPRPGWTYRVQWDWQ